MCNSGMHNPHALQMLPCIVPGPDEIVLPKTSSSVFQSTSIHYLLRSLGVRQLVLCGCVTGWCRRGAMWQARVCLQQAQAVAPQLCIKPASAVSTAQAASPCPHSCRRPVCGACSARRL